MVNNREQTQHIFNAYVIFTGLNSQQKSLSRYNNLCNFLQHKADSFFFMKHKTHVKFNSLYK